LYEGGKKHSRKHIWRREKGGKSDLHPTTGRTRSLNKVVRKRHPQKVWGIEMLTKGREGREV